MTAAQPPDPSEHRQYAGLVSRSLALAVDAVVLTIAASAIGVGVPAVWKAVVGSSADWLEVGAAVAATALPFVYFWLSWCISGCTGGGLLFGIAVRRSDGSAVGVVRAALRSFVGLLFAPVWLLGMVLVLSDPRRRALHDVVMGTVVRRVGR